MARAEAGREAEAAAARHLESLGYRVLSRNWRFAGGELDLVCQDGECTVFVEVRSRSSGELGSAAETVDRRKRRRVVRAALAYAQSRGLEGPMRFDVVALTAGRLEHFEDAFPADR